LYDKGNSTKELEHTQRSFVNQTIKDWMNQKTDNKDGFYSIHYACYNGDPEVIKLLDKYGANLDVYNS